MGGKRRGSALKSPICQNEKVFEKLPYFETDHRFGHIGCQPAPRGQGRIPLEKPAYSRQVARLLPDAGCIAAKVRTKALL